jgi:dimeric dUTPase (all-alpha-NTP-PPase superfamily)
MDKLDTLFAMQASLNAFIADKRALDIAKTDDETRSKWVQREILAMISELTEVLDEVNFKWWKNPAPIDYPALKEEIVDVLHFFISLCQVSGLTPDELFTIYQSKNAENIARQEGRSAKKDYRP